MPSYAPLADSPAPDVCPVPQQQQQPLTVASNPPYESALAITTATASSSSSESASRRPLVVDEGTVPITFLDASHNRFTISARRHWTVRQLKNSASDVCNTPAEAQRLIYMGALLEDFDTLERALRGLEGEKIVHFYPRPVATQNTSASGDATSDAGDGAAGEGAPDSRRQRDSILVTPEIFQAQQRIRLLAFLLLFICSMNVLTLATIFLGPSAQEDSFDDVPGPPGDPTQITPEASARSWKRSDVWNMLLGLVGVYFGLLGIRSSTETGLNIARRYFYGLLATGIIWISLQYHSDVIVIMRQKKVEDSDEDDTKPGFGVYTKAALACTLTVAVWALCWLRAWQYKKVLEEEWARVEAADADQERGDLDLTEEGPGNGEGGENRSEDNGGDGSSRESVAFTAIV